MNSKRFLIKFQFLGFRFHGVQKQTSFPSIQGRVETLLNDQLNVAVATRFASRTDALVSAEESYFLIMVEQEIASEQIERALSLLPPDIKILNVKAVADSFSMLSEVLEKEYHYYFAHSNSSAHPFAAPFMMVLTEELDMELMKKGAREFMGEQNFINYCYRPKADTHFNRTINHCEVKENQILTANFFPKQSYVFSIAGKSFMRGQVRLMVGALLRLGKGELTLDQLRDSLKTEDPKFIKWMVPASGLILHRTTLK